MPKNYLQAAIEIAREAGQILREEFARPAQISYKGDEVDLVTQADKRSEAAIVARITEFFPTTPSPPKKAPATKPATPQPTAGTSILSTAPPISPTAIRVSAFPSLLRSKARWSPP